MKVFLLKQMESILKNAVAKVTTLDLKSARFPYKVLIVMVTATMSVSYAEQQLSDAELDAKYIDVKIIPVCSTEKVNPKDNKKASSNDTDTSQQQCHDANSFVAVLSNNEQTDQISENNIAKSKEIDAETLLAGVFDNIRLLGGTDVLGVPAGVANTGIPLMFGNENYSYSWAGNLSQIFQVPVYFGAGYYNTIYDASSLGYGFRYEARFPDGPPLANTQAIVTHN